jgi:hypothetical protein
VMSARGVWTIPQGLPVEPDGTWKVGDLQVIHPPSLRYLKQHLVFEAGGVFVVDGAQRMPVEVSGPAFQVVSLVLDTTRNRAVVVLDDGSDEAVDDDTIGMNRVTGRFECAVRGGAARALFSRSAHQTLLEHVEDEGGTFGLRVGDRVLSIRT